MTKNNFTLHTLETAPEASRPALEAAQKTYGRIPNFHAIAAESPAAIKAYRALSDIFSASGLTPQEQQIVILSASVENKCDYCVAAHSRGARAAGVSAEAIASIVAHSMISDPKLETLRRTASAIVANRGWISDEETQSFFSAGYSRSQLLDVLVGVSMKTLSNYINHFADPPIG